MTASRISRIFVFAAALALACAQSMAAAGADTNAPVKLGPPAKGAPGPAIPKTPAANPPPAAGPAPAASPAYVPPKKIEPNIEVNTLQAIDPDSAGVLDQSKGGFGFDMWAGVSRSLVQRLVPLLPVKAPSHAMRDLTRRLLLSIAKVPEGEKTGSSLIALRAERLAAMGDAKGMNELLDAAPSQAGNEAMSRTRVDGLLLSDDTKAACDRVGKSIHEYSNDYWQKAFVFCQATAGQKDQARLSLALLRESAADKDDAFFALAPVLLGDSKKEVKTAGNVSALTMAMLRAANQPIPADSADSADAGVLMAIAGNAGADPAVRLRAAERAEASGLMSANTLAKMYSEVSFKPEELDSALTTAEKDGGALGRALLYQAAAKQTAPAARAEAMAAALKSARKDGMFATAARVNAPLLGDLSAVSEMIWFAGDAGRAMFAANDCDHGNAWYELAAGSEVADARKAEAALWPLAVLCDTQDKMPADQAKLRKWLAAGKAAGGDGWESQAGMSLGLLDAIGVPVDFSDWAELIKTGGAAAPAPGVALWTALREAADANEIGATVLFAMLVLGDGGPGSASPIVVNEVVASLDAVGLDKEARRLALEAAVAAP
jgi:hypothetical protein